jgi:outer membrane protein OmpA-like peptidoglycan-associated protein
MMKKTILLLASVSLLPFVSVASADEPGNFYGAARGGVNWAHDEAIEGAFRSKDDRETGWALGAAFGYDFKPIRLELEYLLHRNSLDGLTVRQDGGAGQALGLPPLSSNPAIDKTRVNAHSFMMNTIYDVPVVEGFSPYLGAGIGVAVTDMTYRLANGSSLLDTSGTEVAVQALAGVSARVTDSVTAEVGYRFLVTGINHARIADSIDAKFKYKAHSVLFGLRYAFGGGEKATPRATPAAAPAVTAPVNRAPNARSDRARVEAGRSVAIDVLANDNDPDGTIRGIATFAQPQHGTVTRNPDGGLTYEADADYSGRDSFTYTIQDDAGAVATATVTVDVMAPEVGPFLVFFDFDSDRLTSDANAILQDAAAAFKKYGVARIQVVGHTDRAGPARYNEGLSQRRADSVGAALEAMGVPAGAVVKAARGESDPLVSTGDGVREPQNRRVEILFPQPGA